ncbi:methyl-accepting chemotaxis protein [Undibacterium terreum]|uniref:Methyl-accepting chemotaxis protein n=1 Tax=Undibacterium terreum TaxID=1224302 RepID=A0A916UXS9_9BURK|nr:methyl-accepting chemotaxis protein [Undibacterium terreum]GGC93051.1 methyl-accepting chemotaxis protein [Undibacterium terreum]
MNMQSMKVSTRLSLGFGLVLVMLVMVIFLSVSRMAQMQDRMEEIANVNNVQSKFASAMYLSITERALALRNLILLSEDAEIQVEVNRVKVQAKKYADAEDALAKMMSADRSASREQTALFDNIRTQARLGDPLINAVLDLGLQKKKDEAYKLLRSEFRPVQKKWWDLLNDFLGVEEKQNAEAILEAENAYASARIVVFVFGAIALLVGVMASVGITRSLLRQLGGEPGYAADIAGRIAAGDLAVEVIVADKDHTSLLYAMRDMRDKLANIVGQVRSGTDTIATASHQIASGNLDLSSRTEQQAGSLEETASSMEELTSTVRQNSDHAKQANQLAVSASEVAVKGGTVVAEVIDTMGSINDSSKKIVDIIGVIDGIAFQTNILALNAAVEAARAGEQGRGFAVVASEVRNLAQRSAQAAKEIKTLINDSVQQVDVGARLVDQAGATMQEIVASIRRVTDIMTEIMSATHEQSSGIEQINQAVMQMDDMTQQNAALVEEAAAAAGSLQSQANSLAEVVSAFRLSGMPSGYAAIENVRPLPQKARAALPHPSPRQVRQVKSGNAGIKSKAEEEWQTF